MDNKKPKQILFSLVAVKPETVRPITLSVGALSSTKDL